MTVEEDLKLNFKEFTESAEDDFAKAKVFKENVNKLSQSFE